MPRPPEPVQSPTASSPCRPGVTQASLAAIEALTQRAPTDPSGEPFILETKNREYENEAA
jgi:hypothetical protein